MADNTEIQNLENVNSDIENDDNTNRTCDNVLAPSEKQNDDDNDNNDSDNEDDNEQGASTSKSGSNKRKRANKYNRYSICGCKQVSEDTHTLCWRCRLLVNLPICTVSHRCYECLEMSKEAFRCYRSSMTSARTHKRKRITELLVHAKGVIEHYKELNPEFQQPKTIVELLETDTSLDQLVADLLLNCQLLPISDRLSPRNVRKVHEVVDKVVGTITNQVNLDLNVSAASAEIKSEIMSQEESTLDVSVESDMNRRRTRSQTKVVVKSGKSKNKGKDKAKSKTVAKVIQQETEFMSTDEDQLNQISDQQIDKIQIDDQIQSGPSKTVIPVVGITPIQNYDIGTPYLTQDTFIFSESIEIIRDISNTLVQPIARNQYCTPKLLVERRAESSHFMTVKLDDSIVKMLESRTEEGKQSDNVYQSSQNPCITNKFYVPWEPYWAEDVTVRVKPLDWPRKYLTYVENQTFNANTVLTVSNFTISYLEELARKQLRALNLLNLVLGTAIDADFDFGHQHERARLFRALPRMIKDALKINLETLYQIVHIRRKNLLNNMSRLTEEAKFQLQHQTICYATDLFQ